MVSTCIVDSSDTLPFEGWSMTAWILVMSNSVVLMIKMEAEEHFYGGGRVVEVHDSS